MLLYCVAGEECGSGGFERAKSSDRVIEFARKWALGLAFLRFGDSSFARFVYSIRPCAPVVGVGRTEMATPRDDRQKDVLRPALDQIINMRHPPVRLAGEIDWKFLDGALARYARRVRASRARPHGWRRTYRTRRGVRAG